MDKGSLQVRKFAGWEGAKRSAPPLRTGGYTTLSLTNSTSSFLNKLKLNGWES